MTDQQCEICGTPVTRGVYEAIETLSVPREYSIEDFGIELYRQLNRRDVEGSSLSDDDLVNLALRLWLGGGWNEASDLITAIQHLATECQSPERAPDIYVGGMPFNIVPSKQVGGST